MKSKRINYVSPQLEIIHLTVESGIAASAYGPEGLPSDPGFFDENDYDI